MTNSKHVTNSKQCAKVHETATGRMVRCPERTNHPSGFCLTHRHSTQKG